MKAHHALPLLVLAGCAADFTEPWDIEEPRPMGARVEVEGDPSRPRPRLGERFSLDQYLALPTPLLATSPRYELALTLCLGLRTPLGELACLGDVPLAPEVTRVDDTHLRLSGLNLDPAQILAPLAGQDAPALDPATLPALSDFDRVVLFGVLCADGRPERVPGKSVTKDAPSALYRCVDNAQAPFPDASTFTLSVLLDRGQPIDQNRNPSFACDPGEPTSACATGVEVPNEPRIGGPLVLVYPPDTPIESAPRRAIPWPAWTPATAPASVEGCRGDPSLPEVQSDTEEHTIRMRFDASDREPYRYEIELNGQPTIQTGRESLLVSHALSTHGGEMERYFSELDGSDPDAQAEISFDYTPPKQSDEPEERIPDTGRRVRFYFTLRDQRGGVDFITRELCVVPGARQE